MNPNSLSYPFLLVLRVHVRVRADSGFDRGVGLKVRSHQTRMKRYAQMIYMLGQCKDAIDSPAALFARMRWRELSVWRMNSAS